MKRQNSAHRRSTYCGKPPTNRSNYVRSSAVIIHRKSTSIQEEGSALMQALNEGDDMFTMFRWSTSCLPTPTTQNNPIDTVMAAADELKSVVRTATSSSPRTTENDSRRESTDHTSGTNRSNSDLLEIVDVGDNQQATGRRCLSRKSPPFEDDDMVTMFHGNRQMSFDDDDMFTMFHWASSPEEELFGGRQRPIRQLLREHQVRNDGPTARAA